ncbi:plasmid mobilization relaxosome protein MobC [Ruficoccus amylovorans]|uniref:Plasmid mobilization relaxosome protein MobC n=1 Tax=Ruficoccus amylovorans TaxID=1804625 RepID=A0A842HFQ3_9BACT|nr:plasmid mobilization relaxosome protein MobC [Ruficoccus amylovorans]MBC2594868.1 plasmid mobilization relaxosome protein MobC [Ruficoccus amylovorans]
MPRKCTPKKSRRTDPDTARNIPVTCKLSAADLAVISRKSAAAGKTHSTFLRDAALASHVQVSPAIPTINGDQWWALSKVASNLNQLTHICHISEASPNSGRVLETLDELRQQLASIRADLIRQEKGGRL